MTASADPIGPGKLVLVVGPSGAGKDTLISIARKSTAGNDRVAFPARTVTRPPTAFEENLALTPAEFAVALARGAFALHWQAHGHSYGVPRSIDDDIRSGRTVIVNVSRTIVGEARARYRNVVVVLITAPAEVLAARLAARSRASDGNVGERLQRGDLDAGFVADVTIDNVGDADAAARQLLEAAG